MPPVKTGGSLLRSQATYKGFKNKFIGVIVARDDPFFVAVRGNLP